MAAHKPWITAGFVIVCCSMSILSKTLCSHFSGQGSYYGYTHAWTKLRNDRRLWVSHYAWPLPEVNSTTVRDLMVPFVSVACHGPQSHSVDPSVWSQIVRGPSCQLTLNALNITNGILFSKCANLKCMLPSYPFVQFKFSVYGHTVVSKHTHASCNWQCSPASVGLTQARPSQWPVSHFAWSSFALLVQKLLVYYSKEVMSHMQLRMVNHIQRVIFIF